MTNDKKLILKFLDEIQADIGFVAENPYVFISKHKKFNRMLKDSWK
jgi:hypothetical protein